MTYYFNKQVCQNASELAFALLKTNADAEISHLNTQLIKRTLLEVIANQPEKFSALFDEQLKPETNNNALTRLLCSPRYLRSLPRPFGKTASSRELLKIRQAVLELKKLGKENCFETDFSSLSLYPHGVKRLGRGDAYLKRGMIYLNNHRLLEAVRDFKIAAQLRLSRNSKLTLKSLEVIQAEIELKCLLLIKKIGSELQKENAEPGLVIEAEKLLVNLMKERNENLKYMKVDRESPLFCKRDAVTKALAAIFLNEDAFKKYCEMGVRDEGSIIAILPYPVYANLEDTFLSDECIDYLQNSRGGQKHLILMNDAPQKTQGRKRDFLLNLFGCFRPTTQVEHDAPRQNNMPSYSVR